MNKKTIWIVLLLHLICWLPTLIFFILATTRSASDAAGFAIATQCAIRVTAFISFYAAYFQLFPLISKRKFGSFLMMGILIVVLACTGGMLYLISTEYTYRVHQMFSQYSLVYNFPMNSIGNIFFACFVRGAINWYTDLRYKEQLEKQNLETNLALLKAQINPHFLFNTLNNIDILIEKDQVTASAYLKKLSDILRFTLYETPSDIIPLTREVEYINQYIDLQKIRTNNPDYVSFDIMIDNPNVQVAPMLFIPFLENAFKHSTNKKISNAIQISVGAVGNVVKFNCSNAYDVDAVKTQEQSGLGLELIKSRLELLYPYNHQLDINKTTDRFTVDLSITILA